MPRGRIFDNYLELHDYDSAVETLCQISSERPGYQKYADKIKPVYKTSGIQGVLKFCLEVTLKEDKNACPAGLYARLGMKDQALECLEKSCRNLSTPVPLIIRRPELDILHSEPRFLSLVDTMNLRPYFPIPSK